MKFKASLLTLLVAAAAQATPAQTVTYINTANDAVWPSVPSGYIADQSAYNGDGTNNYWWQQNGAGYYDAFKLRVSGNAGDTISSITISFHFSGTFDDSVAIDLNGNGTIDYALQHGLIDQAYAGTGRPGFWQPWLYLDDATNLGVILTITDSGSSAAAYLYGRQLGTSGAGYLNTLSNISLASLGLTTIGVDGYTDSTGSLRIGFLNASGQGGGHPTLGPNSFSYDPSQTYTDTGLGGQTIPEPSTYGLIGIGALGVAFAARRRKQKSV
jgi:hypothetical protein